MAIKKFNAVSGISVGENVIFEVIDHTANVTANNLNVGAVANLGNVGNVIITGGSPNYVLKTDGLGNLDWRADTVNNPGGSNTYIQFNDSSSFGGSANLTFNKTTNTLTTTNLLTSYSNVNGNLDVTGNILASYANINGNLDVVGNLHTSYANINGNLDVVGNVHAQNFVGNFSGNISGTIVVPGSNTSILFNELGDAGASDNLQFDYAANVLSVTGNLSVSTNITRDNKTVPTFVSADTVPSNPVTGDQWYDRINDRIYQYIYDGSTHAWVDTSSGYITANTQAISNTIVLRDGNASVTANAFIGNSFIGDNGNVAVTTNTLIDSFDLTLYRTAKYIITAKSDDGFQSLEALLIHDDSNSFVTVYGAISTIIDDIVTLTSDISSGNVNLYASTVYANTTVNFVSTFVKD